MDLQTPFPRGEEPTPPRIAVIGGGITGLAAAWQLQQKVEGTGFQYTLLEASGRWGGKIRTERIDGFGVSPFVVEAGPDAFVTQKPWALELARELGLEERLLGTDDRRRRTYVRVQGRLTPLPEGIMLIVPTRFRPFLTSRLFSLRGKLRMGLELFIPPRQDETDETLADFIRRRLGAEVLDRLGEPLLAGIYNADAERQSLLATFPRFRELERRYGSLTRGMWAMRRRTRHPAGASPRPLFMSFRTGMAELVEALVPRLTGDLRLNTRVEGLERRPTGGYRLRLSDGGTLEASGVILAIPAAGAAHLLADLAPEAAARLRALRTVSTGTVSLAFRAQDAPRLEGFGVVIPRSEGRAINAITWTTAKFPERAPEGYELVRVFFGGSRTPHTFALEDTELLATVQRELAEILGIRAAPLFHRIHRWPRAQPQYDVGHLERVAAIEAALPPDIRVVGSPYRGVGIPDCIHQGREAALCLAAVLETQRKLSTQAARG